MYEPPTPYCMSLPRWLLCFHVYPPEVYLIPDLGLTPACTSSWSWILGPGPNKYQYQYCTAATTIPSAQRTCVPSHPTVLSVALNKNFVHAALDGRDSESSCPHSTSVLQIVSHQIAAGAPRKHDMEGARQHCSKPTLDKLPSTVVEQ